MRARWIGRRLAGGAALCLSLAACAPQEGARPASLAELMQAHNWNMEEGARLDAAFDRGVRSILGRLDRPGAIEAITQAGFECTYGEAHERYPDPMAVCARSFATRACQLDWEIWSTAREGRVDEAGGAFRRDCVGTDRDWPDAVRSAIDDQLAPPRF